MGAGYGRPNPPPGPRVHYMSTAFPVCLISISCVSYKGLETYLLSLAKAKNINQQIPKSPNPNTQNSPNPEVKNKKQTFVGEAPRNFGILILEGGSKSIYIYISIYIYTNIHILQTYIITYYTLFSCNRLSPCPRPITARHLLLALARREGPVQQTLQSRPFGSCCISRIYLGLVGGLRFKLVASCFRLMVASAGPPRGVLNTQYPMASPMRSGPRETSA